MRRFFGKGREIFLGTQDGNPDKNGSDFDQKIAGNSTIHTTTGEGVKNEKGPSQNNQKKTTYGLTVLYHPPENSNVIVDIVFIHGLTGDSQNTWRDKNSGLHWPSSTLSKDVNDSRILSFGYDANVVNFWDLASQNRLSNHAENLLGALTRLRERTNSEDRKLIFVVHSLGGLLIQNALGQSRFSAEKHIRQIEDYTMAIAFLGTPHFGADLATLAEFIAKIATHIKLTNVDILSSLRPSSEALANTQRDFHNILRLRQEDKRAIAITCFYEELPLPIVGKIVVERRSAVIPGYASYGIHAHHKNMTKFSGPDDAGYIAILGELCRWIGRLRIDNHDEHDSIAGISRSAEELECLRCFYTSDYESKKLENSIREAGTCEWFLQHPKYQQLRNELKSSVLRLTANPGHGKSVLASFLINELQSHHSQVTLPAMVCFFFFQSDDEGRNNASACLRALLHQIFILKPALLRHAIPLFYEKGSAFCEEFHTLWGIFVAVTSDPVCGNVVFVIDALDECEDRSRPDLIDSLVKFYSNQGRHLPGRPFIKCILTTRPYRYIERKFRELPNMNMEAEDEIQAISADVAVFIKAGVASISTSRGLSDTVQKELEKQLMTKSDQTFLWVSLALQAVEKSSKFSNKALHDIIGTIPSELDDVYEAMLQQSPNCKDAKRILQIMVATLRPLSLDEMNVAFVIKSDDRSSKDLDLEPSIADTIADICGVFLKVVDSKLHFIHQTAREFLIRSKTDTSTELDSWKSSLDIQESHTIMARSCVCYLLFDEFELDLPKSNSENVTPETITAYTERYAFFEYAAKNWGYHIRRGGVTEQESLMASIMELCKSKSPRFQLWFEVFWSAMSSTMNAPLGSTALMVASYFGHTPVIRNLLDMGVEVSQTDSKGFSALHWACWEGHGIIWEGHEAVQLLLEAGIDFSAQDIDGFTALHWAATDGQVPIIRLLLDAGIDPNVQNKNGLMAQHLASSRGRGNVLTALLEAGISIDIPDSSGRRALIWAINNGHDQLVELLIKNGADLSLEDESGVTALQYAATRGDEAILSILHSHGADLEAKDVSGMRTLHYASYNGHKGAAKLLLERGASLSATAKGGETPLHIAAGNGHTDLVEFLLGMGAAIEAKTDPGLTPLHFSSRAGHVGVSQLLLENGANLEVLSNDGHTSLHFAAAFGKLEMVALLIEKGANMRTKDKLGWTVLHHALKTESDPSKAKAEGLLQLLLENGAELEAKDNVGHTPMHFAASKGLKRVMQLLLEKNAQLEATDDLGATPLQKASLNGHDEVLRLLIENGANFRTESEDGTTPLHQAALNGHEKVIHTLIEKGLDVNATNREGWTALHFAAAGGQEKAVSLLLQKGAFMEAMDSIGATPLSYAAFGGHSEAVRVLLEKGANFQTMSKEGTMPIHDAAKNGHEKVVHALLEKGANIEAISSHGLTALHFAVGYAQVAMTRMLLDKGANPEAKDIYGQTILQYASWNQDKTIEGVLLEKSIRRGSKAPIKLHRLGPYWVYFLIFSLIPSLALLLVW